MITKCTICDEELDTTQAKDDGFCLMMLCPCCDFALDVSRPDDIEVLNIDDHGFWRLAEITKKMANSLRSREDSGNVITKNKHT